MAYNPRILIVDDDKLNVKLLAAKLSTEGYRIFRSYGGVDALRQAVENLPDLILLDIMMPDIDGYEVTQRLKADPATRDIPIVLITALGNPEDKLKGLKVGADEFLNRPVDHGELLARIRSLVLLKQYREQLHVRLQSKRPFAASPEKPRLPKKALVLLVEDEEAETTFISDYLHEKPYQVEYVKDGIAAVKRAQAGDVDVLLLDILLPGLNGFDVCRQLKDMAVTQNIQIIIVTSLHDLDTRVRGLELGADDFLVKPIHKEILLTRIDALIKKKRYIDELTANYESALQSAISDSLTGLYNHSYFEEFLAREMERSRRQKHSFTLIMLDIDDFKRYNDTLGHPSGDTILKEFSRLVSANIRKIDLAARYGGEEFVILLTYTMRKQALFIANRLRQTVENFPFSYKQTSPFQALTVSIGIAEFTQEIIGPEEIIRQADSALYKAKAGGKNRVCVYSQPEETENSLDKI